MGKLEFPLDGRQVFFGGKWVELEERERIPAISPSDESLLGYIVAAKAEDVDGAVTAARPALADWKALSIAERSKILKEYGQRIKQNLVQIADLDVRDAGMTRSKAEGDVRRSIKWIDEYCAYAFDLTGRTFASSGSQIVYTTREPYGIVGQIVPFNHPENFAVKAIAPAVLTGNAVIVKPPEQCSLSALALAEITRGLFPPGIVNVLTGWGHEVGAAIVRHPAIPRLNFTGSVPTGRRILEGSAQQIKHVTLELGGKNPLVVTRGVDSAKAAEVALKNMNLTHAGQSCQSSTRVLVHESLYDETVDRLAAMMSRVKVGDPKDPATNMGPLAFRGHYERVLDYIRIGQEEGARLRFGGKRPPELNKGYYLLPTLLTDVTQDMRVAREEIFGPVVCLMKWSTEDEVIAIADGTEMGLNCRVFAPSVDEGLRIGRRIESGLCYVNTVTALDPGVPTGGFKQSGFGKRNCAEEVISYTRERTYAIGLD